MARKEQEASDTGEDGESWWNGLSGLSHKLPPHARAEGLRRSDVELPTIYACSICPDWKAPLGKELWEILREGDFTRHNQERHNGNATLIREVLYTRNLGPDQPEVGPQPQ